MPVIPYGQHIPRIAENLFIAPDAWITGDVELAEDVSVFFGVAMRGDIQPIRVGPRSNLQEHAILHTSRGLGPCIVGEGVTVGHRATLHGCIVEANSLIGMGATVLDGAVVGENSIVGAQSLVPLNMKIPPGSLVLGVPAKVIRPVTEAEIDANRRSAEHYVKVARNYRDYFLKHNGA